MKYKVIYFVISLLIIVPGVISLLTNGLKLGVDFTGGSLLEVAFTESVPSQEEIIETLTPVYEVTTIQQLSDSAITIRGTELTNDQKNQAVLRLQNSFGQVEEQQFATIGPSLSRELIQKTLVAVVLVATFITLYISRQFKNWKFGLSAIAAMLHDSIILLGIFSMLGYFFNIEVDILFVTALLTTLSFSVHDTIVVFDRIRELQRKNSREDFETVVGAAVLETLGRSINNSMTIIIMLLSLVLLGGQTIFNFALALLIGAVTGTYSSTFTAAPLLLLLDKIEKRQKTR